MIRIKKIGLERILFVLLGLSTSMAIIQIPVLNLTLFNFLLYVTVAYEIVKRGFSIPDKIGYIYIAICLSYIASTFINYKNLPSVWIRANFTAIVNAIVPGYLFAFSDKKVMEKVSSDFLLGLKACSWIQLIWGIGQFALYQHSGIALNSLIFGENTTLTANIGGNNLYNGILRLTGLNWEPAYFALAMVIGYALSNRAWQKIAFVSGVLLSNSKTGILVMCVVAILDCLYLMVLKKSKQNFLSQKITLVKIGIGIISLGIAFAILIGGWNYIANAVTLNLTRFQSMDTDASSLTHLFYYQKLNEILFNKFGLFNLLFGIGPVSSGYAFMSFYGQYLQLYNTPWQVENGLASILIGDGIIGAFLIYLWFGNLLATVRKYRSYFVLLIGILFGTIFYSYFVNWVWVIAFYLSENAIKSSNNRLILE